MTDMWIMAAALFLGSVLAAQAGAWDEFMQRCLLPLERGALAHPMDMDETGRYKNDGDTSRAYESEDQSWVLEISDGRGGKARWCFISAAQVSTDDWNGWSDGAMASGRYAPDGKDALRSTDWRTTAVRVTMQTFAHPGVVLKAGEIN